MADAGNGKREAVSCKDFLFFQDLLKKMRTLDDRVVHALNTSIPTDSFSNKVNATDKCKELHMELLQAHQSREHMIKNCIDETSGAVKLLRHQRKDDMDNIDFLTNLRREQRNLRMMEAELNVEEVIQDRTNKVFYERCRLHYIPETPKT